MYETLVSRSRDHATRRPDELAVTFLEDGEDLERQLTYAQLDDAARRIASALRPLAGPGDRALLVYPPGLDFIQGFLGCLYAGVIPVPVYPPGLREGNRGAGRLARIASNCQASAVLTTREIARLKPVFLQTFGEQAPELKGMGWVASDDLDTAPETEDAVFQPQPDSVVFLQYTSGSTAAPKGVVVTYQNLLANFAAIQPTFGIHSSSHFLSWLPLYHDMGLIGIVLQALHLGAPLVLMSPFHFLQKPMRWPRAVSKYRANISGGPNFAFDLCVRRSTPEERQGLDLSCWSAAFNGAEPLRSSTVDAFYEAFAPAGLPRRGLLPCYGLAEVTLFASGTPHTEEPVIRRFSKDGIAQGEARGAAEADEIHLVSSGRTALGHRAVIVHPETGKALPDGQIGEIWFQGPSVARGYWGLRDASRQTFEARLEGFDGIFLRTGDLGFLDGEELFVTGRLKDLLILRGQNYYPQDIERTVESVHPALRPGGGAAFAVEVDGEDRLVHVHELRAEKLDDETLPDSEELARTVSTTILDTHGIQPLRIVFIEAGTLPKTSSGKVRRAATRAALDKGELQVVSDAWLGGRALTSKALASKE